MKKTTIRIVFGAIVLAYVATHFVGHAHAQSSLGIGTAETAVPSTGLFSGLLNWINVQQQQFYRALTGALKSMRENNSSLLVLVGLSFAYGVFHAAGPGHGKAVISSYMLANEVALRRGIMLSFVSAFLQAAVAILLISLVFLFLRGTSVKMTDATWFLEIASYLLITLFGAWLLWQKSAPRVRGLFRATPAHSLSAASTVKGGSTSAFRCDDADAPAYDRLLPGEICASCGHSHALNPAMLSGDNFSWKTAWSAVAAVGMRPCSGALIVLTFAFLNGLWLGGILSVLAMALGTAITVSILATMAVTAKNWAVAFAGDGRMGNRVHATIEIAGAAMVFLLGALMLSATLLPSSEAYPAGRSSSGLVAPVLASAS
ncbi:MAG: nickel/cobalt transporter [Mesorhizobium sp.]|nr:nickel/cobalt transporter [Mesorhizobium sp.]MBL8578239.1 nickel/cobalt transporter [Mesorhizobium sp.]